MAGDVDDELRQPLGTLQAREVERVIPVLALAHDELSVLRRRREEDLERMRELLDEDCRLHMRMDLGLVPNVFAVNVRAGYGVLEELEDDGEGAEWPEHEPR